MPAQLDQIARLVETRDHDPFGLLGAHPIGAQWALRTWQPGAREVQLETARGPRDLQCLHPAGLFELKLRAEPVRPWTLRVDGHGTHDAYAFLPTASTDALYLFGEGRNWQSHDLLGALPETCEGVSGVRFRVWAPSAGRVSVIGSFNHWDGRRHLLQSLGASGVWELFVPGVEAGAHYKFELRASRTGLVLVRADPYARLSELRPGTNSIVAAPSTHRWQDEAWITARGKRDWLRAPINIYELHAGSWMRHPDNRFYSWRELAARLVPYVVEQGYTHIELLPLTEHPLDESWGYQSTGFFSPTARLGDPEGLRELIDACHAEGIGVVLDWVPGHFPANDGALAWFDGDALFEHPDPNQQCHPDWGTSNFDYGRTQVASFLLSSAWYWLSSFHFDGLRVDSVASMLQLDYNRPAGQWSPNRCGGRENLAAVAFLRALNTMVAGQFPGAITLAEESTTWPKVTYPPSAGGLGFTFKWNMGWMNDTLRYLHMDPYFRRFHHALLTFGQMYIDTENFLLPLSHDEVVHAKGSLMGKMPGDPWQRRASVRLLFVWQLCSPGKKLGFMGNEFAQWREWSSQRELDWDLAAIPDHAAVRLLQRDLNLLYRDVPALHELDRDRAGFLWIDCNDAEHSTISFLRRASDGSAVVVVLNFTPVAREGYRLGVPAVGKYKTLLNSDDLRYGGSNVGSPTYDAESVPMHGQPASIQLLIPPLGALVLAPVNETKASSKR